MRVQLFRHHRHIKPLTFRCRFGDNQGQRRTHTNSLGCVPYYHTNRHDTLLPIDPRRTARGCPLADHFSAVVGSHEVVHFLSALVAMRDYATALGQMSNDSDQ